MISRRQICAGATEVSHTYVTRQWKEPAEYAAFLLFIPYGHAFGRDEIISGPGQVSGVTNVNSTTNFPYVTNVISATLLLHNKK